MKTFTEPQTPYTKQDLEQGILAFLTEVEEYGGNYTPEGINKLRRLVTVEQSFPPVSYHDNWTGKEVSTDND